jgi:hypothetical protein
MNLKFAVISFGICLFGSILSMSLETYEAEGAQFVEYDEQQNETPSVNSTRGIIVLGAQPIAYNAQQEAAIAIFVEKVGNAWAEEAKEMIYSESEGLHLLRSVRRRPGDSDAAHHCLTTIVQFHHYPSKDTYKKCVEAQLRLGVLNLRLLERVRSAAKGENRRLIPISTPEKMRRLLPALVETLGLRVVYPENPAITEISAN